MMMDVMRNWQLNFGTKADEDEDKYVFDEEQ